MPTVGGMAHRDKAWWTQDNAPPLEAENGLQ